MLFHLTLYLGGGFVLVLWTLRRLTEQVVLTKQGLFHSVLGKKTFVRYDDIAGIEQSYLLFKATSSPERITVIEDVRKQRLSFSSYLSDYDRLVACLAARAGTHCSPTVSPSRWTKLANRIAIIVFLLCMAALAWSLWLNR